MNSQLVLSESKKNYQDDTYIDMGDNQIAETESYFNFKNFIPAKCNAIYSCIAKPWNLSSHLSAAWPNVKTALLYITSVVTSVPVAVYAFSFPLNIRIDLMTMEMLRAIPLPMKALAIVFMMINLGIGTMVKVKHLPEMINQTKEIFLHYCESLPKFFENNFILLMACVSAVATLALGYYGFVWGGQALAVMAAMINFSLTFGFRVTSMSGLINDIRRVFDNDSRFQSAVLEELKRLRPEHIAKFEQDLQIALETNGRLTDDVLRKCLVKLYDKTSYINLDENNYHSTIQIFNPPTLMRNIKNTIIKFTNLGLGAAIGTSYYIFFSQSGFEGISLLCKSASSECAIDALPYAAKFALATLTGTSSGILGFIAGAEVTTTLSLSYDYMKNNYSNMAKTIAVFVGSSVSATALAGAAKILTEKPNIFNLTPNTAKAYLFIGGNWLLATSFDANAIMAHITKKEISYNQALRWLEKNKLSSESISALKHHSHFKQAKLEISQDLIGEVALNPKPI